jgi:D-alanyl-D-alanine carboxypeptidase/D-alanyl-D-alanine-endopeptidase (penicillin-binding protein 4)
MRVARAQPGGRATLAALVATTLCGALAAPAAAAPPDTAGHTPVAASTSATATTSITRSRLRHDLSRLMNQAGSSSGAWVYDASSHRGLFSRNGNVKRTPASNLKLFTSAVAVHRFGPSHEFTTSIWAVGKRTGSKLDGNLIVVGGGDPLLASASFARRYVHGVFTPLRALAKRVQSAGITTVTGHLYFDDSIFDRRRGVPASGYRTSQYIGPLSGLDYNQGFAGDSVSAGFAGDPAKFATQRLVAALRGRGVQIATGVARKLLPAPRPRVVKLGAVRSPTLRVLLREMNRPSVNFFAEMLLKGIGARFGGAGTTRAGARVVRRVTANFFDVGLYNLDGSGLDHRDKVSPHGVGRLLKRMLIDPAHAAFVTSLPKAGRQGTLKYRMRGTAAEGRCRAKTGTLTGVSALSGYCFNRSGKTVVFSILMNNANVDSARSIQDRMTTDIARYG